MEDRNILPAPEALEPLCDICQVAGPVPPSAHCIFNKYHDADFECIVEIAKPPVQLAGESVHHCYGHLPRKKAPTDQTGPDHSRKRTKHGLWPRCCSHTSTTNHGESKTRDKTGSDARVGICIKTIFADEYKKKNKRKREISLSSERKSKGHVARISCVLLFLFLGSICPRKH